MARAPVAQQQVQHRQVVAERLAAGGRGDHDDVAAGVDRGEGLGLVGVEARDAPLFERGPQAGSTSQEPEYSAARAGSWRIARMGESRRGSTPGNARERPRDRGRGPPAVKPVGSRSYMVRLFLPFYTTRPANYETNPISRNWSWFLRLQRFEESYRTHFVSPFAARGQTAAELSEKLSTRPGSRRMPRFCATPSVRNVAPELPRDPSSSWKQEQPLCLPLCAAWTISNISLRATPP